jgi:hypothetical protein
MSETGILIGFIAGLGVRDLWRLAMAHASPHAKSPAKLSTKSPVKLSTKPPAKLPPKRK